MMETNTSFANGAAQANALGAIAESYDVLHNLATLSQARHVSDVVAGTRNSALHAVFQAAEIALLNLVRLTRRATKALQEDDLQRATEVMRWVHGFHLVMRRLGDVPKQIHLMCRDPAATRKIGIAESPAMAEFLAASEALELQVNRFFDERGAAPGGRGMTQTVGLGRHTDLDYALLNLARSSAHEMVYWEANLNEVVVELDDRDFDQFVASGLLGKAVMESQLQAETCYTEFVALHQVPEILSCEANDHIDHAVRDIRAGRYSQATERLQVASTLLPAMVQAQQVMGDCLSANDYHIFRDNLGPASGMHSLSIRYHMLRDLFTSLWGELETHFSGSGFASLEAAVEHVDLGRHDSAHNWQLHNLLNAAFRLYDLIEAWRHEHLHMPRNCLGGGGTKSMIGVPDGLLTVKRMREGANALASLNRLHRARGVVAGPGAGGVLSRHVGRADSLDQRLLRATGAFTRDQFPHVQEKETCPFSRKDPARRP
ncbi:hypothetical protein [Massilia rubra]|uniref:Tryptophan 2,3-dioxygenase n=1 Tax=Massilia rubra TaxID=2607910 RepID=A0ABX0LLM0_9BURK|nr:hypothetical protein [Massilia rubra]NHZ33361.1 hypothetical protein [Massilia rubra]